MGKLLGIDFGLKRTGLAITDDNQIIASPLEMVVSEKLIQRLLEIKNKETLEAFVLGLPLSLDGGDTHITENVRLFKAHLEKTFPEIPVYFQNEQYSSKRAMQAIYFMGKKKDLKNKGTVDKVSAAILLQDFLEGWRK